MRVFDQPSAFFLLIAIPVYFALLKSSLFSKPSFPLTLQDWKGQGFEWRNPVNSVARIISTICFCLAYVLLVFAIAEPTSIEQEKKYTSRSSDVVFVLDVSPSMAALDIANGTRLDAAKQAIKLLVMQNDSNSYGLVSCATEAALLVPPTMDQNAFFTRLDSMKIGELGDETALGLGISTGVYHLVSTYAPKKSIVLLTDGENNSGSIHPQTAASLAKDYGITLYIIGIGTRGSVPIEYVDPVTGTLYSGYLDSGFDNTSLQSLASITDGTYYTVETLPSLSQALQNIGFESTISQVYTIKQRKESLYAVPLFLSAILFALAWVLRRLFLREIL